MRNPPSRARRDTACRSRLSPESLERRVLFAAGILDPTFGNAGTVATTFPGGNYGAVDAALTPEGKIVAVGAAYFGQQASGFQLLRYQPDGALDATFGNAGRAPAPPTMGGWVPYDMALAPDGKIVVGGAFIHTVRGQPDQDFVVARFNADGSVDTGFGNNGVVLRDWGEMSRAHAVAVQPDGKVLASGWTTWSGDKLGVLRFNEDGSTDTTFGVDGIAQTEPSGLGWTAASHSLALGRDGKIFVGGSGGDGTNFGSTVVRYNADGSLDTSFNGTGSVTLANVQYPALELHAYDDGRVLVAGEEHLARLLEDGRLDPAFSPNGRRPEIYRSVFGIDVGPDGKIATTSQFENFATFRYRPDGRSDSSWGPFGGYVTTQIPGTGAAGATWDETRAVLVQADSKVIAVGSANGGGSFGLARYQGDASPPEIAAARFVTSPRVQLEFTFTEPVRGLNLDDLQVINAATGQRLPYTRFFANFSGTAAGVNDAEWVPLDPLPGGNYRAVLPAGSFTNADGIPNAEFILPFTAPSSDVTPPRVDRAFFTNSPRAEIHFEFSEDVLDTLDLDDLVVVEEVTGERVSPGDFFLNARGGPEFPTEAVWVPAVQLVGNFVATLPAGSVADPAGNALAQDVTVRFTLGDPLPYVTSASFTVAPDGTNKEVVVYFSEGMDEGSVRSAPFRIINRATGAAVPGIGLRQWTGGTGGTTRAHWGGTYVLPTGNYRAVLPADGVRSLTGQPMAADFTYDFSVGPQPDNMPPTLVRSAYLDWPTPQQRLQFEFDEDVVSGIDREAVRLVNLDTGQTLPASALTGGAWTYTTAQWSATQPLPAAHYRATVPAGSVRDRYGNGLRNDAVLEFEVTGPGDRTPPRVVAASVQYFSRDWRIYVDFSESILGTVDPGDLVVTDLTTGRVLPSGRFSAGAGGGALIPSVGVWNAYPPLPYGPYRATLRAGSVADPSGNALAADYTFEFTVPDDDREAPVVVGRGFSPGERPNFYYTFNEDVSESLAPGDLVVTDAATGRRVPPDQFTVEWSDTTVGFPALARWYLHGSLAPGRYDVELAPGAVTDRSGNAATGFTLMQFPVSGVVGRHLFYNNSTFDGRDPAANAADDAAVAADKLPLLPGQAATFSNVTSYTRGINGIMIDVAGLPIGGTRGLIAADFAFGTGAPAPTSVSVRPGAGVNGSDRVTLTWPDGAIVNRWLGVTVLANFATGLATPERFSFGNLVGETGDNPTALRVNSLDLSLLRRNLNAQAAVTGAYDFDRDGRVTALDLTAVRRNLFAQLAPPAPVPAQPAAAVGPSLFSAAPVAATTWLKEQ